MVDLSTASSPKCKFQKVSYFSHNLMLILVITEEQEDKDVTNDAEFSYKEVSELSDATDDI